jgi:hypothetical protein
MAEMATIIGVEFCRGMVALDRFGCRRQHAMPPPAAGRNTGDSAADSVSVAAQKII